MTAVRRHSTTDLMGIFHRSVAVASKKVMQRKRLKQAEQLPDVSNVFSNCFQTVTCLVEFSAMSQKKFDLGFLTFDIYVFSNLLLNDCFRQRRLCIVSDLSNCSKRSICALDCHKIVSTLIFRLFLLDSQLECTLENCLAENSTVSFQLTMISETQYLPLQVQSYTRR